MGKKLTKRKKEEILTVYKNAMGNVTRTCDMLHISRRSFYNYKNSDADLAEKLEEIDESNVDFAETMLLNNIREGKETSLIFFLKTKGKKRGYVETVENQVSVNSFEALLATIEDDDIPSV